MPNPEMMIGERSHANHTIQVPPWPSSFQSSQAADFSCVALSPGGNANCSPNFDDYSYAVSALQRYLPSNVNTNLTDLLLEDFDPENDEALAKDLDLPVDAYSCDQFRMFEFKVRKCMRGRSHDWTECPYAHPGEKARRRDPRKYHYSGTACPDFRKGSCRKGDACEFAHGVFECWLHPARYRTQPCKDGMNCRRRVCFFAHSSDQLRVLSPRAESYDGSPHRLAFDGSFGKALQFISSPESGSPQSESPPMSPMTTASSMNPFSRSPGSNSINEIVASMRQLQLNKLQSANSSWGLQAAGGSAVGSPRMVMSRVGYGSLPSTPTRMANRNGIGYFDTWDNGGCEEEPVMERVESGRDLRAKIFQKLSKENPLDRADPNTGDAPNPDVGWVTDLIN